jgi:hypothetical protein
VSAVLDRIEAEQAKVEGVEAGTALDFLQAIYRNPSFPLGQRIRCAIEALPFEAPKLQAVAHAHVSGRDFAEILDRRIARHRQGWAPKVIGHRPTEGQGDE